MWSQPDASVQFSGFHQRVVVAEGGVVQRPASPQRWLWLLILKIDIDAGGVVLGLNGDDDEGILAKEMVEDSGT